MASGSEDLAHGELVEGIKGFMKPSHSRPMPYPPVSSLASNLWRMPAPDFQSPRRTKEALKDLQEEFDDVLECQDEAGAVETRSAAVTWAIFRTYEHHATDLEFRWISNLK